MERGCSVRSIRLATILVLATAAVCPIGAAPWDPSGADSLNIRILGSYPVTSPVGIWDCAAYVDGPTGHEYGILGADSVYVIDLARPSNPRRVSTIPPLSPSRNYYVDVDVRGPYLYAAGRFGPIRVIDLSDPRHPVVRGEISANEFCACSCGHPCRDPQAAVIETLFIDERGILYVSGIECGEGIHMYDIATDPIRPRWLCHVNTRPVGSSSYTHDMYARDGILYLSRSRETATALPRWDILDGDPPCPSAPGPCGDGRTPALISSFRHDGAELHSHSAFPLENQPYLLTCDEKRDGHVRVWNIVDLAHPFQVAEFHPDETCHSIHNVYLLGNVGYAAWYNKGIQILDLSSPEQPERIGYYEHPARWKSRPSDDCCDPTEAGHAACYGIPFLDPFFPSGIFVATEINGGLLVGRFRREAIGVAEPEGPMRAAAAAGWIRVERNAGGRSFEIVWDAPRGGRMGIEGALEIFSSGGRWITALHPTDAGSRDRFVYLWDGRDAAGHPLPAGVYFARPSGGPGTGIAAKLLLLGD
jgi:hypothetical protein